MTQKISLISNSQYGMEKKIDLGFDLNGFVACFFIFFYISAHWDVVV